MGARPYTLRCPSCKVLEEYDTNVRRRRGLPFKRPSGENLRATGKSKVVGKYGRIYNVTLYEIQHAGSNDAGKYCGRVFWSNHSTAQRLCVAKWLSERKETA